MGLPGAGSLSELARKVLASMASGALAVLNAHFYSVAGKPFYQAIFDDPAAAYREASSVMPESMVKIMFREVLRRASPGASKDEVDEALRMLARGDASKFLELAGLGGRGA